MYMRPATTCEHWPKISIQKSQFSVQIVAISRNFFSIFFSVKSFFDLLWITIPNITASKLRNFLDMGLALRRKKTKKLTKKAEMQAYRHTVQYLFNSVNGPDVLWSRGGSFAPTTLFLSVNGPALLCTGVGGFARYT